MTAPAQLDWYACTLISNFDESRVLEKLGGLTLAKPGGRRLNYPASYVWETSNGGTVQVWYGAALEVHIELSSGACDTLVDVIRKLWPHRVSRADVAIDYDFPNAFETLYRPLDRLAQEQRPNRVKTHVMGDWIRNTPGRTLYLGAFRSRWLGRIYEKGAEQAAKHPDQTFSPNWVRVEAQVRPSSSAHKLALASMTPDQIFAYTKFGSLVLAHLRGVDHVPLPLERVPSTDPEYWLGKQYGATLSRWLILDDSALRARLVAVLERVAALPTS